MQEESSAGVEEDTRQDGHPRKRDEIHCEVKPQSEAGQANDDKHLQTEEEYRRYRTQIGDAEDIEIDDKQQQEQAHQHRLTEDRERTLFVSQRFIVVGTAQRLQYLIVTLRDKIAVVNDFLPFLHHSLGR